MEQDQKPAVSEGLQRLRRVVGEYVWGVRRGADDVLKLEFGPPHLVIQEPLRLAQDATRTVVDVLGRRVVEPTGKWHLFVEDGDWAVVTGSRGTRRFDTDPARADAALRQLDGQRLTSVDYLPGTRSWHLRFDLGGSLAINRATPLDEARSAESVWILFSEGGAWFAIRNDMRAAHKP
ncbi:MAG: hypothetical protein ACXWKQ_06005 [Reyranella sp.]